MPDLPFVASALRRWLLESHLDHWLAAALPEGRDDYVERLDRQWRGEPGPPYHIVATTRLLYSFSIGRLAGGGEKYLAAAERMYRFLLAHFGDEEHGGWFWSVDGDGPLDADKRTYGHVFAILALSTYHQATGDASAITLAVQTRELLEEKAWEAEHGGFGRIFERTWQPRAAGKRLNEQMHALEAMLALHEVTGGQEEADAVERLCELTCGTLVQPWGGIYENYTADWRKAGEAVWPGHQLEFGWLLVSAGRRFGVDRWTEVGRRLIAWGWRHGWDGAAGGVFGEVDDAGNVRHDAKSWWPQCEAIVAALMMASRQVEDSWMIAAHRALSWMMAHMEDPRFGGIFAGTDRDGNVLSEHKANEWKAGYHVTQAIWTASVMLDGGQA